MKNQSGPNKGVSARSQNKKYANETERDTGPLGSPNRFSTKQRGKRHDEKRQSIISRRRDGQWEKGATPDSRQPALLL